MLAAPARKWDARTLEFAKLTKEDVGQILAEASKGDIECQTIAGMLYANGVIVKQDVPRALVFLDKSARAGHAIAQLTLGEIYAGGELVPQDYQKAFNYYTPAAAAGDAESICNLGVMYELGQYVKPDLPKAIELYQESAKKGLPYAKVLLGDMYYYGRGVDLDRKKACELYKQALAEKTARFGLPTKESVIYQRLGLAYLNNDIADSGLTKQAGLDFLKKAFTLGETSVIQNLVMSPEINDLEVAKWVKQSAEASPSDSYCLVALGQCYEFGYATSINYQQAVKCYQKAHELGNAMGTHYLAYAYFNGQGINQDPVKGFELEKLAAETVPQAQFNIGLSYLQGQGTPQDLALAKTYLQRAADNGYEPANEALRDLAKSN